MASVADNRLMQQVRDLVNCLDTVKALRAHRIHNVRTSREDVAVCAQDSQAVIPELIASGADGYLKLVYEMLTVFLIGATQELAARQVATQADSSAADVASLTADFNALLAKLRAAGLMV